MTPLHVIARQGHVAMMDCHAGARTNANVKAVKGVSMLYKCSSVPD